MPGTLFEKGQSLLRLPVEVLRVAATGASAIVILAQLMLEPVEIRQPLGVLTGRIRTLGFAYRALLRGQYGGDKRDGHHGQRKTETHLHENNSSVKRKPASPSYLRTIAAQ
jgi:hypothetical protein